MIPATTAETVRRFHAQPLLFPPAEGYHYSGLGYLLLALVVETVSGDRIEDFVRRAILEPAGMHDTGAEVPETISPGRSANYLRDTDGGYHHAPYLYMPLFTGSGNFYSTVGDLTHWLQALQDEKIVPSEVRQRMFTPVAANYGYGLRIDERFGRREISHGGKLPGSQGYFLLYPEERLSVVVLGNNTFDEPILSQSSHAKAMAVDLAAIVFKEPVENE
jgi:CubicO group peptidase (beta-lactamase class C family)